LAIFRALQRGFRPWGLGVLLLALPAAGTRAEDLAGLRARVAAADGPARARAAAELVEALSRDDPKQGIALGEAALAAAENGGDRAGAAALETALGGCLDALNRDADAIQRFERGLADYRGLGDLHGQMRALRGIGTAQFDLGRIDEAVATLERARALAERAGTVGEQLAVASELAHVYQAALRVRALQRQRWIVYLLTSGVVLALGAILIGMHRYRLRGQLARKLDFAARHDPLTGLSNRRDLVAEIEYERARSRRSRRPFAVMMGDLDDFKAVNDRWGHEAGDAVLVEVARRLRNASRSQDIAGRWGGEEFLFVLPETDRAGAGILAAKVHDAISARPIAWRGEPIRIAASFGVAEATPEASVDEIIRAADAALLAAKRAGKDRVEIAGIVTPATAP
jgi:diguanylate cyclase (GGDEF)-like protein